MKADTIFHNANIITMDTSLPSATTLVIGGDRIIAVGGKQLRATCKTGAVKEIDCQGKTLVPGFHDAHCHILGLAGSLTSLDCSPANVRSIADIKNLVAARAVEIPTGKWIVGAGYDDFYLAEKRHPNRWDLDVVSPDHPVRLNYRSIHACVLNSKALELAGITIETADPPGALIDRKLETGEPTGILFDMNRYLKTVFPLDEDQLVESVKLAGEKCLSLGITSIQDATVSNNIKQWRFFKKLKEQGLLDSRVSMMAGWETISELREEGMSPGFGDDNLRLGAIKIVLNRSSGSLYPSQEELEKAVLAAHTAGFQVAIHAIEEDDIAAAAAAVEKALLRYPRPDHRHRIEHCAVCPDPLPIRLKDLGLMVVTQPAFLYYSGDRYLCRVLPEQHRWLYRINSLANLGIVVAAGSDSPVAPNNPMVGIYSAIARRSKTGRLLDAEGFEHEAMTVKDALAMYTSQAAFSAFEESYKGTLSPGKLADLVLLDRDLTRIAPEEIKDIKVVITVIGGSIVWQS